MDDKVNADEVMTAKALVALRELLSERGEVDVEIKERKAYKDQLSEKVTAIMADTGHTSLRTDQWNLVLSAASTRVKLDKAKLVEAGVSVEQLKAGSVETSVAPSLRVTRRKESQAPGYVTVAAS